MPASAGAAPGSDADRCRTGQRIQSIKTIAREFDLARNTVRKVLRSGETNHAYVREVQPRPKLGAWTSTLDDLLEQNERRSQRERVDLVHIHEDLRAAGYAGGYDAVRRYARHWARRQGTGSSGPMCR